MLVSTKSRQKSKIPETDAEVQISIAKQLSRQT